MTTWLDPMVAVLGEAAAFIVSPIQPLPSIETEAPLGHGSSLVLPPRLPSTRRLQSGNYEPEVTNTVRSILRPGMTFVDVGANVGYYAVTAAGLVGETGRVYAFEPEPSVFRYLKLNIERSAAPNISALPMAVSDQRARLTFVSSELERGFLSSTPTTIGSAKLVEAVSLDAFFGDLGWPPVDLIKVDVEGAEISVLDGMSRLSARNPSLKLIVEVNLGSLRRSGRSPRDIGGLLLRLGFDTCYLIEQDAKRVSLDRLPTSRFVYNLLTVKGDEPLVAMAPAG